MEQNKLEISLKQNVITLKLFALFTFFAITFYFMKSCIDVKTIHQATEATRVTRQAYGIYTNVKFGWTVYNKVQEFSKKKDLSKEETRQTEQTETTNETETQTDEWQDKKRSGKNEPHKNQDAKVKLEKQVDDLKQQVKEMKQTKPENRFKGFGKKMKELEKKIDNIQQVIKQQGATHGRKGKGFK